MNLTLKRYVALSKKTTGTIGAETGHSRQSIDAMIFRNSPVYVESNDTLERIKKMYRYEVMFDADAKRGEDK